MIPLSRDINVYEFRSILVIEKRNSVFENESIFLTRDETIKLRDYLVKTLPAQTAP